VVLRRDDHRHGLRGFELGADGSGALLLSVAAAGHAADHDEGPFVRMNGPEVYKFATRVVVDSSLRSLEAAGLGVEDVDVFVPHQANRRIIDHAARRLGLDEAKVFSNVDRYGNTSAGSIPICLDEAWRQGRIGAGDVVLMVGFGGGLAWGSCVMEWTKERA
jgi:3-oxoacyl-[acyl-carrier-protein] synthase-3